MKTPFYFFMIEKKAEWMASGHWEAHWTYIDLARMTRPLWNQRKENPHFTRPYIEKQHQWKLQQKVILFYTFKFQICNILFQEQP